MTEEQAEQLLQELSQMSEMQAAALELLNNVKGYLEWLMKGQGHGIDQEGLEAQQVDSPTLYWNRLNEVRRDGSSDAIHIPFHANSEPVLPNTLTDEEKAHIAATVAAQATRARAAARKASRLKPRRKRRTRR